MQPENIEQLLFEHAVHTKIRPPLRERLSMLRYNHAVSAAVIASAALACTMAMTNRGGMAADLNGSNHHPLITDTDPYKRPLLQSPSIDLPQAPAPETATLAMSRSSD